MKKYILILTLLTSLNILAQEKSTIIKESFVECYYPTNAAESIFIHENTTGESIAELPPLTEKYCWYKFAISESKDGWLKIENIFVGPACEENELNKDNEKYKGYWILAKNLEIDLPDSNSIDFNFYSKPNTESKIVFTANEFMRTFLIAVNGTWAKVRVEKDGKEYIGWLEKKYQCPYPWTTCPVWD